MEGSNASTNRRHLIVGVDPGTTTAVAVLDFNGGVVGLFSSKHLGLPGVIEYVMPFGRPSVVACDVSNPPEFVSKVASKLGAVLYHPDEPLSVSDKIMLSRGFDVSDSHQRDALAAALYAFSRFRNKFEKIDSLGLDEDVKHLVLRGVAIGKALSREIGIEKEAGPKDPVLERELSKDEKRIKALEKRVVALLEQLDVKDSEIKGLQADLARARRESTIGLSRDRELSSRNNTIRSLRNKISVLETRERSHAEMGRILKEAVSGRLMVVGVYPEVNSGLTLVKTILTEKELPKLAGVKVFFTSEAKNKRLLGDEGFTVADPQMLKQISDIQYINKKDLEQIKENRRVSIDKIVLDYRRGRS